MIVSKALLIDGIQDNERDDKADRQHEYVVASLLTRRKIDVSDITRIMNRLPRACWRQWLHLGVRN